MRYDEDGNDADDMDRKNRSGYECGKCGYEPTQRELNKGSCPGCSAARVAALRAQRACDAFLRCIVEGLAAFIGDP